MHRGISENIAAAFVTAARRQYDDHILLWPGGSLTWRTLDRLAAGFAQQLDRDGVEPGARIALSFETGWPFVVALLGVLKHGATVVPLSPRLTADEYERIASLVKPSCVVRDVTNAEADYEVRSTSAPALIMHSTGTTGEPRAIVLSHAALSFALTSWAGAVMQLRPNDVVLSALSLSHGYGLCATLLAPLLVGARVVLLNRFTPTAVLAAIEKYRITVFLGVPTMFSRLLGASELAGADLTSLRLSVVGAAPCSWELVQEWRRRAGSRLLRGYGMTELFRPISYVAERDNDHPDAVGQPVPGVEVRIVDDRGADARADRVGELWVRTPARMTAYLDPSRDAAALRPDGWFDTGDLASMSGEGFVTIAGRRRSLILRGGYTIVPREVEAVLVTHPAVADAVVKGVAHPDLGEEIEAFVTLHPGVTIDAEEIVAYCKERLAPFKYPRLVTIVSSLPTRIGTVVDRVG